MKRKIGLLIVLISLFFLPFGVFAEEVKEVTVKLTETGKYQIQVSAQLNNGEIANLNSDYYIIDKEKPIIETEKDILKTNDEKVLMENVKATDNIDGDITSKIVIAL